MRKTMAVLSCTTLLAASPVLAAEFQPIGNTLGIGGAGVARTYDAYAPYWNPAGLAFNSHSFSSRLTGGAGIRISSSMAENVDRIGKLDVNQLRDLNITNLTDTANNRSLVGKAGEFVGVLNDLDHNDGNLSANADAVLGFQYDHFAVGGFSTMELASFPSIDTAAVAFGGVTTPATLATAIGATPSATATTNFFTSTQSAAIASAFGGGTTGTGIANALDAQYGGTAPVTGQSNQQLSDALVKVGSAMTNSTGSLENNGSTLEYRGLILVDVPLSYGYPIDLGRFGTLGVGGSVKVMWGRAFIGESQIVQVKNSGDIVKNITDHYQDSTTWGVDLGALWRYSDWLNVGVVAKNLNSPEFDAPTVAVRTVNSVPVNPGGPIKVKPMVRTGISLDPLSWLTIAGDLDLTENDTVLIGQKSRNIGGGVEIHPLTWFKLRGGIYKNLANGEVGAVPTFGLTLGTKWVNFDLDGAMALKSGRYKDTEYPREARAQFSLNFLF